MNFIDTHQHLIYRNRFGYEWTKGIPPLAEGDYVLENYASLVEDQGMVGTIFMEAGVDDADYKSEARFIAGLVGAHGMLGQIASCRPEDDNGFDAWLEECSGLSVLGYRRVLHVMPDELSQTETFRANLRKIGKTGQPFDVCVLAQQLPVAAELARACDDQPLVLNHCGVPDIAGGNFDGWADNMRTLAGQPNVTVKLSGLTAYCNPGEGTAETLKPWVDFVIETFGPGRMVWGSDWPVVNLGSGLVDWIGITRTLLKDLSRDEQNMISQATTRAVYKV